MFLDFIEKPNKEAQRDRAPEEFKIFKADEDKRLVFGWASVSMDENGEQLVDRQGDMIDPEDMEESAYNYVLNFRDTGVEHIPYMRKKGKLVESCVFTREKQEALGIPEGILPIGWWVGFKIHDDETWEGIKAGRFHAFSVEGVGKRTPVEKSAPKSFLDLVAKYDPSQPRDRYGKWTSGGGGGFARDYGATNTGDALAEINSGKSNSLAGHMDENGKLTPEREALHKQIIDDMLAGKIPVEGQATMTMLGGGPASGKSSVMSTDTSKDPHAVTVDPDAFKKMLPGFNEMAAQTDQAASFYHEESSALAKRFSEVAYKENYNVIYDGTGDGSVNSVMKKVNAARENGYRVEAKYVSIDTEEAVRRNQKRYDDAVAQGQVPRLPPVEMVRATHAKCTDISVQCAKEFDRVEIWDNNGARGQQKLIATGGNGKGLVATDAEAFNRYLSKSQSGLDGFMTLPTGEVVFIG